ncbi:hypothetical protein C8A03DRAFT_17306 [Achaetomium macrosporum]|uniref:Uncharacterized protein n=1 Tax=Achaetomium macrosporum TaxID=79813 RepID=A0AAN7HA65_9PEZI|nr:hypothetical protein C8A03DRAFT_17306 [Achaetomium macrosporum]
MANDPVPRSSWAQYRDGSNEQGIVRGVVAANSRSVNSQEPRHLYTYRYSGSSFFSDTSIDEDRPTKPKLADTKASQPGLWLPMSRTFSILSGLTKSFSSGSITSRGNSSRNVNGQSSESSTVTRAQETSRHPLVQVPQKVSSQHDQASPRSPKPILPIRSRLPDNPKEITTAMPPQYWTGRFMALHDRFHNELLEPHQLTQICEAQKAQFASPPNYTSSQAARASAAAKNNPSISAYASTRVAQTKRQPPSRSSLNGSRLHSRIPQSVTSGAILQTTMTDPPPSYSQAISSSSRHVSSSRHILPPATASIRTVSTNTRHLYLPTSTTTAVGGCSGNPLTFIPEHEHGHDQGTATTTTANQAPNQVAKSKKSSTYLTDSEESRTYRVLLHLEHMCTTPEARASLRSWQAAYARKTGRAEFLPSGVSLTTTTGGSCSSTCDDDVARGDGNTNSNNKETGHEFGEKGKWLVKRLRRSLLFSGSHDRGNKSQARDKGADEEGLGRDGMGFVHAQEKEKGAGRCMSKSECGKDGSAEEKYADLMRVMDEEIEESKRRGRHFSFF